MRCARPGRSVKSLAWIPLGCGSRSASRDILLKRKPEPIYADEQRPATSHGFMLRRYTSCREAKLVGSEEEPRQAGTAAANATRSGQIVSKQRVTDHGEVLTGEREVNAMLDLVKQETERIDSRFLEPACGTGNFLIEVLRRKLRVVEARYRRSQLEFERYAVLAVSSLYGIDILEDNVEECRRRLFRVFDQRYTDLYRQHCKPKCRVVVQFILGRNIVWGDALTLSTVDETPRPIEFSEWSLANGSLLKRRDYAFRELLPEPHANGSLFAPVLLSDRNEPAFIPEPIREFPPVHFLDVADADS